jgi:hypothetical protein
MKLFTILLIELLLFTVASNEQNSSYSANITTVRGDLLYCVWRNSILQFHPQERNEICLTQGGTVLFLYIYSIKIG